MRACLALAIAMLFASPAFALSPPPVGALSPQTLRLPDGPASVRGLHDDASVDGFTAQLSYAVPITLPKGIAGFQPSLTLHYNGALGNGALGIGWSLGEIAIRRSTRLGVPTYTDSDELELVGIAEGGRLVRISDGTYRVEGQGHRFKVLALEGGGFEVFAPNGHRYRLGATPLGRDQSGAKVSTWRLETITEPGGQAITYTHTQAQGRAYLSEITWGPEGALRAVLGYELRPDIVTSYRTGFQVVTERRLARIDVRAFGESVRSYELSYDDTLSLSRLATVTMKGRGGEDSLPPLSFSYPSVGAVEARAVDGVSGWALDKAGVTLADIDGDGLFDLLRLQAGNAQYRKNLGGRFGAVQPMPGGPSVDLQNIRLMDVDGDLRPEIVRQGAELWSMRRLDRVAHTWETSDVSWPGSASLPLGAANVAFADVDGDGRLDALRPSGEGLALTLNSATGFRASRLVPGLGAATPGAPNVRFFDVNGDGLADVVWLQDQRIKTFLGRGDGTFVPQPELSYPWPAVSLDAEHTYLADLNRDGLMDLVLFSAGTLRWYRGLASGGFLRAAVMVASPDPIDADASVAFADLDGNGSDDVVWSSSRGMWSLDLAGPTSAAMIAGIDNGLGKRTRFTYAGSAALDARASEPWARHLPISVPVVLGMSIDTGAGEPARELSFGVRDGFWDSDERRFGGFLSTTRQTLSRVELTRFDPGVGDERVLRGKPTSTRLLDADGTLFQETLMRWEARSLEGLGASPLLRQAQNIERKSLDFEGVDTPIETRTSFTHDALGRVQEQRDLGRTDQSGDERTQSFLYGNDDALWVRDLVCEAKITDGSGTLVSHVRTLYGDETAQLPLCEVGKGWLRSTQAYHAGEARWIDLSAHTYDTAGRLLSTLEAGAVRRFGYL